MIEEEDFNDRELSTLKQALTKRSIPFKRSIDDPEMSLQLPNYTVIFFYKRDGIKMYNAGVTPNECNVWYLTEYTPDIKKVLDLIVPHITKRYVAYEKRSCEPRSKEKLLREVEEILNELGVECSRSKDREMLHFDDDISISIREDKGMARFVMYDRSGLSKYSAYSTSDTLDLLEVAKTYKKIVQFKSTLVTQP